MKKINIWFYILLIPLSQGAHSSEDQLQHVGSIRSDLYGLAFELFQRGYSEYEATGGRLYLKSRFIPQDITAYPDPANGAPAISMLARYRHNDSSITEVGAKKYAVK